MNRPGNAYVLHPVWIILRRQLGRWQHRRRWRRCARYGVAAEWQFADRFGLELAALFAEVPDTDVTDSTRPAVVTKKGLDGKPPNDSH